MVLLIASIIYRNVLKNVPGILTHVVKIRDILGVDKIMVSAETQLQVSSAKVAETYF